MEEWACNGIFIGYRANNSRSGFVVDQMGHSWDINQPFHGQSIGMSMNRRGDVTETKYVFDGWKQNVEICTTMLCPST